MFGGNFLITVLVAFPIAMVVIRLGIFNNVAYKFGTQRSLTTSYRRSVRITRSST